MADIGDEGGLGQGAGFSSVAGGQRIKFLALQPDDQLAVLVAQVNAFIQQPRHAVAIAGQHRGEQHHQHRSEGGIQPALPQQKPDQWAERENRMDNIGGAMRRAGDEFRRRHAQEGQRQIGLGREAAPHEPEQRRRAPGGAGNRGDKGIAPRPVMRVAAFAAVLVGGGELFGGDHHGDLQQQRHQWQHAGRMSRDQGGGHAQHGKGQGEIMPAERIQDIDAAGIDRVRASVLWRDRHGHCVNPCRSLAFAPFRNA
jgi:hypothetical protein